MKNSSVLSLLILLFVITSCGGNKSSQTTLMVTQSMMLSNTDFSGGLVIQGQGPGGERFSHFIERGGSDGNKMNILLPKGVWNFRALGWMGATSFMGPVSCGEVTTNLSGPEASVELLIGPSNCDGIFGNTTKSLELVTCGHYYKDYNGGKISQASDKNYCSSTSDLLVSDKKWASSARIFFLKKDLGSPWKRDFTQSFCLDSGTDGILTADSLLTIPTKGLPLGVTLYQKSNCQESQEVTYFFPKGLDHQYLSETIEDFMHESLLTSDTLANVLFLSTSPIKRGSSSLMSLIPSFSGGAVKIPVPASLTPPTVFVFGPGSARYTLYFPHDNKTCSDVDLSTITGVSCEEEPSEEGKKVVLHLTWQAGENHTFTLNDLSLTIYAQNTSTFLNRIFTQLHQSFGHQKKNPGDLANNLARIMDSYAEEENDRGKFARVARMFHADGPGGVLGEISCNPEMNLSKTISFFDEEFKTYQVEIQGKNQTDEETLIPAFICNNNDPEDTSCSNSYDAVMTLRRRQGPGWITESIVKFSCSGQRGELETQKIEAQGESLHKNQERLFWNTNSSNKSRYESYRLSENEESGLLKDFGVEFERAIQLDSQKIKVLTDTYSTKKEGSIYQEKIERLETTIEKVSGNHKIKSSRLTLGVDTSTPSALFDRGLFKKDLKKGSTDSNKVVVYSPNKNYFTRAFFWTNSLTLISSKNGASNTYSTLTDKLSVDVVDNGKSLVCRLSGGNLYAYYFNGTSWDTVNSGQAVGSTVNAFTCKLSSNNMMAIVYLTGTEIKFYNGVSSETIVSALSDPEFVLDAIWSASTLKVAYAHKPSDFTISVYTHQNPALTESFSLNGNSIYDLEISSLSPDTINIRYQNSSNEEKLDQWRINSSTPPEFEHVLTLSNAYQRADINCFESSNGNPTIDLGSSHNSNNCPYTASDSNVKAIKSDYTFTGESLDPSLFKTIFTSSEVFEEK